jgi:hypothetical protein
MLERWMLAAVPLVTSTIAAADPPAPISVTIGVGVRGASWTPVTTDDSSSGAAVALHAIVAARVTPHLAIGLRFGVGLPPHHATVVEDGNNTLDTMPSASTPFDAGLTVQYEHGPWWIAPWLGVHTARVTSSETFCNFFGSLTNPSCSVVSAPSTVWTDTFPELGLTAGFDVARIGSVGIGLYANAQVGTGDYKAAEIGLAFHE